MVDGKNFFDWLIKSYIKTYENIPKITTGQGDDFTTSVLLDYNYFKKVNNKHLMSVQKQYSKLILLEI